MSAPDRAARQGPASRRQPARRLVLLALLGAALAGCGKKGPLRLPEDDEKDAP